jgi:Protein of unknown function (DUF3276)
VTNANFEKNAENIFSEKVKAGNKRTYFFDVKSNKKNDYYVTITESRKRYDDVGYDRSKIFIYKEDFNKFIKALSLAIDHVKTELMPNFDFNAFNHENYNLNDSPKDNQSPIEFPITSKKEDVDKW